MKIKCIIAASFFGLSLTASSASQSLRDYCLEDPDGKLYQEIYGAKSDQDAFKTVGLNPEAFKDAFKEDGNLKEAESIYEFAVKFEEKYPEVGIALDIWELNVCIDRGPALVNKCTSSDNSSDTNHQPDMNTPGNPNVNVLDRQVHEDVNHDHDHDHDHDHNDDSFFRF